jgi:NADH-quinone oxidoreductase subunit I
MSVLTAVRDTYAGFKSLLTGMRITAREAAKPIITVQYPHDTLPMPARFRGHIQLVLDPVTGKPRCNACTLCMKACPSGSIVLDGLRREGDKKKSVTKYELDFTTCSLCGSCVEACPSDAIDFSKDYNVVSLNRDDFAHMDLFAKIQAEAEAWAKTHEAPIPPAAPQPGAEHVSVSPAAAKTGESLTASATPVITTAPPPTTP